MTKTFPCILCTLCYCRNVCAQKCFVLVFAFTSVSYSFIVTLNSFDLYNYYYCWRRRKENNCNTIKYMDDAYDMQSKLFLIIILCNEQKFCNQLRTKIRIVMALLKGFGICQFIQISLKLVENFYPVSSTQMASLC